MAVVQGMGVCLIPTDGIPCGRQIEEGEPIGTLALPFGGTVIGHKACVDGYNATKNKELDEDMVKRVDQAGPGGPVDMTKATDALVGSIPLEQSPTKEPEPTPDWGEGVKPVADIPLGSPPPEASLPDNQPWLLRKFTPEPDVEEEEEPALLHESEVSQSALIASITAMTAILNRHQVQLNPELMGELLVWKHTG